MGETLELAVGTADDRLLMAAGRDAVKKLKKAIDQSKTATGNDAPPMRISMAAAPFLQLIAEYGDSIQVPPLAKAIAGVLSETLKSVGGKDHLTITAKPIPQGIRYRLEIEEGLLKATLMAPSVRGHPFKVKTANMGDIRNTAIPARISPAKPLEKSTIQPAGCCQAHPEGHLHRVRCLRAS